GEGLELRLRLFVRPQRREPPVAPARARGKLLAAGRPAPFAKDARDVALAVDLGTAGRGLQAAVEAGVACAIVGDPAGRVELDRFERPHERPAQAEPVFHGL